MNINIDCRFRPLLWSLAESTFMSCVYTCEVTSAKILQPGTTIKAFMGKHNKDRTNDDVQGIEFFDFTVHYIPKGLSEIFPNLAHLAINYCGLKKICRQDLIGLENLITLEAERNEIEVLPNDVFTGMKSLKRINFYCNHIESINSKVLEPIKPQLEFADFRDNSKFVNFLYSRTTITSVDDLMSHVDFDVDNKDCQPDEASVGKSQEKSKSEDFLKRLWTTKDFSDLTVFAGNKQFKVHKAVIAVHSMVFEQMFKKQPKFEEGEPKIEFSAEATNESLEYLYTGKQPSTVKAPEVLELAVNYEMQELKEVCVKIIENSIDESNVLDVLELANRHGIPGIKARAFEVFKSMFPENDFDDSAIDNTELLKEMIAVMREFEEAKRKLNTVRQKFTTDKQKLKSPREN